MIAIVLGGAKSVWAEAAAARRLLEGQEHIVIAANMACIYWPYRLDAVASYHGDRLPDWTAERAQRGGNMDFRVFTPNPTTIPTELVSEAWDGSSGLYATRCALFEMAASGAILCGVPLIREAGHFVNPGQWAPVTTYRQEWQAVAPLIGERTRSMAGWTAQTFGTPSPQWIAAHA